MDYIAKPTSIVDGYWTHLDAPKRFCVEINVGWRCGHPFATGPPGGDVKKWDTSVASTSSYVEK